MALASCKSPEFTVSDISTQLLTLDTSFKASDPQANEIIQYYKSNLDSQMNKPLGLSKQSMGKNRPEGLLGNWCADAVQYEALKFVNDTPVFTLLNHGGLRTDIPKGTVTLGKIYEVMPFDNELVLILMSATDVDSLVRSIVENGGEPVSGIRINACKGQVQFDIDSNASDYYWVATSDYLANGGDDFRILSKGIRQIKTGILIRDALVNYIMANPVIETQLTERIKICP